MKRSPVLLIGILIWFISCDVSDSDSSKLNKVIKGSWYTKQVVVKEGVASSIFTGTLEKPGTIYIFGNDSLIEYSTWNLENPQRYKYECGDSTILIYRSKYPDIMYDVSSFSTKSINYSDTSDWAISLYTLELYPSNEIPEYLR